MWQYLLTSPNFPSEKIRSLQPNRHVRLHGRSRYCRDFGESRQHLSVPFKLEAPLGVRSNIAGYSPFTFARQTQKLQLKLANEFLIAP
jgi:hypothetical protein